MKRDAGKYGAMASRSGFGLVEILVVIVIISILAVVMIPRLTGGKDAVTGKKIAAPRERAKQVAGSSYTGQINQAIQMYRMDHEDRMPPNLQALKAYGVTDEMLLDPNTRQPLPYNPQTGQVGGSTGQYGLGGGASLPQVGN